MAVVNLPNNLQLITEDGRTYLARGKRRIGFASEAERQIAELTLWTKSRDLPSLLEAAEGPAVVGRVTGTRWPVAEHNYRPTVAAALSCERIALVTEWLPDLPEVLEAGELSIVGSISGRIWPIRRETAQRVCREALAFELDAYAARKRDELGARPPCDQTLVVQEYLSRATARLA